MGWSEGWQLANRRATPARAETATIEPVTPSNVPRLLDRIITLANRHAETLSVGEILAHVFEYRHRLLGCRTESRPIATKDQDSQGT